MALEGPSSVVQRGRYRMTTNGILEKADAIAAAIRDSEAATQYWQAREKMENHPTAQALFEELKLKTNASLILQERLSADHPKVMLAELEIHQIQDQLQQIPVAIQYKNAQDELNELMQGVVQTLLSRLSTTLPLELGPRQGCGKGHGGNGCDCNH